MKKENNLFKEKKHKLKHLNMSVDSGIIISYAKKCHSINIIENLLQIGWTINDGGHISYLPLGDDDFNWQYAELSDWEAVKAVLFQKEQANELIGICLTFEDTNIGFSVLFMSDRLSIILSTIINRVTIAGSRTTDFSWYLNRLTILINNYVTAIECRDYY